MTSQTYNLDGPKEFPFPHPVRSADQLTVEIVPGAAVAPGDYEVVGVGPTSTQVTVRYPNAPTSGGLQLKITRYVAPERVTQIDSPSDINVTNLNAEFNTVYEAMTDLEASVLQQVQDMLDDFQTNVLDDFQTNVLDDFQTNVLNPAVATTLTARDEAVDARNAAREAETGAEGTWGEFQDHYWGAYATDPSTSPVGNPPDAGDLYFNTTASEWRVWNGSAWQQPNTKIPSVYDRRDYVASGDTEQTEQYTSTEGQTFYAFPYDAPAVGVFATPWGLLVEGVDYTYEQGVGVTLIPGASAVPDPVPEGVTVFLGTVPETFPVNYDPPFVQVWVNGALLPPSDYEASSGTDVVPNDPLPEDTEVTVIGISGASATELGALVDLILATPDFVAYTDEIEGYVAAASDSADEAEGYAQDAQQAAVDTGEDRQATEAARGLAEGYRDEAQAAEGNAGDHEAAAQQFAEDAEAAAGSAQGYAGDAQGYASTASGARDAAVGAYDDTVTERQAAQAAAGAAEGYRDQAQAAAGAASDSADEAEGYAQEAQDALVAEPRILRAFGSLNRLFRDSSLWLDFKARSYVSAEANGDKYTRVYGDILTLSAPSPKWVWNAQGQLVEVPAGQPAYDHDPVTGEPLGQRIEAEATNRVLNTDDLSGSLNQTYYSVSPAPSIFESGVTATRVERIETASNGPTSSITISDGTVWTAYAIIEQGSANRARVGLRNNTLNNWPALVEYRYDTDDFLITSQDEGGTYVGASSKTLTDNGPNGGRVVLLQVQGYADSGDGQRLIYYPCYGSEVGEHDFLHFMQFENSPVATSPIITTNSAVTRAADVATIPNLDTADWYGGDEGAFLIEFSDLNLDTSSTSFLLSDGGSIRWFYATTNGDLRCYDGENMLSSGVDLRNAETVRAVVTWDSSTTKLLVTGSSIQTGPHNGNLGAGTKADLFGLNVVGVNLSELRAGKHLLSDDEMHAWINGGVA